MQFYMNLVGGGEGSGVKTTLIIPSILTERDALVNKQIEEKRIWKTLPFSLLPQHLTFSNLNKQPYRARLINNFQSLADLSVKRSSPQPSVPLPSASYCSTTDHDNPLQMEVWIYRKWFENSFVHTPNNQD